MNTKQNYVVGPIISYNLNLKEKAKTNRQTPTAPEKKMWAEVLQNRKMKGFKFLRQKPLDNYIVDFYCSELKLVIEIDGASHGEQEGYDKKRTKKLNDLGIMVVRYWNNDVMENIEGVFDDLERRVQKRKKELTAKNS